MIFNGEWKTTAYKITRTVITYDDRPELYPGSTAEAINLTAEQSARLDEIRYTPMAQSDAIAYVFDGIGTPPDNRSDVDKLIDLIPAENINEDVLAVIPEWTDEKHNKGQYIKYHDAIYKVLQTHQSQPDWTPELTPSLFAPFLTSPDGPTAWVQPESTNQYMVGDRVIWTDGKIYESTINNNVWSISAYPAGWKEISA